MIVPLATTRTAYRSDWRFLIWKICRNFRASISKSPVFHDCDTGATPKFKGNKQWRSRGVTAVQISQVPDEMVHDVLHLDRRSCGSWLKTFQGKHIWNKNKPYIFSAWDMRPVASPWGSQTKTSVKNLHLSTTQTYHGLAFVTPDLPFESHFALLLSNLSAIPSFLFVLLTSARYGRKYLLLGGLLLACIFSISQAFVPAGNWKPHNENSTKRISTKRQIMSRLTNRSPRSHLFFLGMPWFSLLLPVLARLTNSVAYTVIYILGGELFPTVIRGSALGLCSTSSQSALVMTPYIIFLVNVETMMSNGAIVRLLSTPWLREN